MFKEAATLADKHYRGIGGVLTSKFLTLFLLPMLYDWAEGRSAVRDREAERAAGGTSSAAQR
jgi:hypothetical protein